MRRFDAIVVGARCAGAATAMLLARRGLRVLAIDRGRYGTDALSTHALMRSGVAQLARWGLLDAVRAAGTPPVRCTTFHYEDGAVAIPIKPAGGVDALYAPRRTVLDRILADGARDAGAELRFETTLTELVRDATGRVTGARVADPQGRIAEVRGGIVIGADGVRSRVAEQVGAVTRLSSPATGGCLFGYVPALPFEGYNWAYRPGEASGMAGAIPTNDGEACVFAGLRAERLKDRRDGLAALFMAQLSHVMPALAEAVRSAGVPERLRIFPGIAGHIRQAQGPGWALVGDAGYFKDPATAHGITDAFRDSELLARAVAVGTPEALADYEHLRDALSLPLFRVTEAIAAFDWTTPGIKANLARLNEAMRDEARVLDALNAATPLPGMPRLTAARAAARQAEERSLAQAA